MLVTPLWACDDVAEFDEGSLRAIHGILVMLDEFFILQADTGRSSFIEESRCTFHCACKVLIMIAYTVYGE